MSEEITLEPSIPFVLPPDGLFDLGSMNGSAVGRLATLANEISKRSQNDKSFVMPRSQFAIYVADRITGEDKQDMSMIISGRKGSGKSRSSLYIAQRVAEEIAWVFKQGTWKDYFSLENNCALLEDTEGINKLIKSVGKHQVIVVDDAGVAVGSRDFATTKNKNFNTLLTICRTRRWFLIFNVPVRTHVDKQIRELVDCVARVYKPYHKKGFNILKVHSVEISETNANKPYSHRYVFKNRKVDMWVAFSPDKEMVDAYEAGRDAATDRIIMDSITGEEKPVLKKRDIFFQKLLTSVFDKIKEMDDNGISHKKMIAACPEIKSEHMLNRILANIRSQEEGYDIK